MTRDSRTLPSKAILPRHRAIIGGKLMPSYRRYFVPGGTYFFTVKTARRAPIFQDAANARILGNVFREAQHRWPWEMKAIVLLPDHLHAIWILPNGDSNYSARWAWIKKEFSKRYLSQGGHEQLCSESQLRHRRRGVWQRRFWEHLIRDEAEFEAYFAYLHWNPVKHGYVEHVRDWPHSSFHRWVRAGVLDLNWGSGAQIPSGVANAISAGE